MAWIRMEPQMGVVSGKQQWDGICELTSDLTAEASAGYAAFNGSHIVMGAGSIAACLEDSKPYVKKSDGSWAEVGT